MKLVSIALALIASIGLYPTTAKVVEVNRAEDTVTVEDFDGSLWEFEGAEDWLEGDICSLLMSDNGTESIFDDIILSVRYSGYYKE